MKKWIFTIMCTACLVCLTMTGCKEKEDTVDKDKTENSAPELSRTDNVKGYYLEINGTKISVGMDMAQVLEKIGEPQNYFESESCADQGVTKLYSYASFDISTDSVEGKDIITLISLKDDLVVTPEGVYLSMTKEDVINAYGSNYVESEASLVYKKEGVALSFILDGENISSIQYVLTEE